MAVLVARAFQPFDFPFLGRDPLVMLLAALRIGQRAIGAVEDGHDARRLFVARVLVRVVFLAQRLVGGTYDFLRRHARHFQVVIVSVYLSHRSVNFSTSAPRRVAALNRPS
jgi:hypothetical protein